MKWKTHLSRIVNKMLRDNSAAVMLIAGIVGLVLVLVFMGIVWLIISNMKTIGIGVLYMGAGLSMVIGAGALMMMVYKKYIASGGD